MTNVFFVTNKVTLKKRERERSGDWLHIFPLEKYEKYTDRTGVCGEPRDGRVDGAPGKDQKGSAS